MKFFSVLWEPYVRWRHSKGYGVHSPYAFRMVNDVINPGDYGYYGYSRIERAAAYDRHRSSEMKLLLRLALFLDAKRLVVFSSPDRALREVAKSVAASTGIVPKSGEFKFQPGDLLVAEGSDCIPHTVAKALEENIPVIALDLSEEVSEILGHPMASGLFIKGERRAILVPRKEMAYTRYTMKF